MKSDARTEAMKTSDFWKNFGLGQELSVSGTFIYNGLRRFHEIKSLEHTDELFELLYHLSVGLERLLKIAIVLYEHNDFTDQEQLENSLITHNHLELLSRVRGHAAINLGDPQVELLGLLSTFYKSHRYDRFAISSVYDLNKEKQVLLSWIGKHLAVDFSKEASIFGNPNEDRYRRFFRKHTLTISRSLYKVVEEQARSIGLFTYELRYGSKAYSVFLREVDVSHEDVLWKELLLFFMNTNLSSGYLNFLRGIDPLEFDPALIDDYLDCFQSDTSKAPVMDELEHHYSEMDADVGERLKIMQLIGSPGVCFDIDEDDGDC